MSTNLDREKIILQNYLPPGSIFGAAKVDRSIGPDGAPLMSRFTRALANEFCRVSDTFNNFMKQIVPYQTHVYLSEWERAFGLPDVCFGQDVAAYGNNKNSIDNIASRQLYLLTKMASLGVQTRLDFQNLADKLGFGIRVLSGMHPDWRSKFPLGAGGDKEARFTIVIEYVSSGDTSRFTYTFDPLLHPTYDPVTNPTPTHGAFPFETKEQAILECLFENLKPANCEVLVQPI